MSDLDHYFGNDLVQSATGDLLKVDSTKQGQQRVLRRLLSNPALKDANGNVIVSGDYIFHPEFGAGLPRMVGDTVDIPKIKGVIRGQLLLESVVSQNPEPVVNVQEITDGVSVYIQYNDKLTKKTAVLSFDVNR